MPQTRAAKRIKLDDSSNDTAWHFSYGESPVEWLESLNGLSSKEFASRYLSSDKLKYRSPKQPEHEYTLEFLNAHELDRKDLELCFMLVEQTSKDDYAPSSRGWHPRSKRAEMREDNMRYLIVRRQDEGDAGIAAGSGHSDSSAATSSSILSHGAFHSGEKHAKQTTDDFGFLSFQLDDDWTASSSELIPILYVYEIHLGKQLRGIGLGAHLMDLAREIAIATQMSKVELSVFTSNTRAVHFYRSLGYEVDETSPDTVQKGKQVMEPDWLVLSILLSDSAKVKSHRSNDNR